VVVFGEFCIYVVLFYCVEVGAFVGIVGSASCYESGQMNVICLRCV